MTAPDAVDQHPMRGERRRPPWATIIVVAVYIGLAVAIYGHMWASGPSAVVQPGGDQLGTVWFLRWTPFALLHGHNPFFSDYANYPFGVN